MSTYLEEYQGWLEMQMAAGGTPDDMQSCVDQYNATGRVDFRPGALFTKWCNTTSFVCTSCQAPFKASEDPDVIVELARKEVTCEKCSKAVQDEPGTHQPGVLRDIPTTPPRQAP